MRHIISIFLLSLNINSIAFSQDHSRRLKPKAITPESTNYNMAAECPPTRQIRELGAINLDITLISGESGHGSWGDYSSLNNQGAQTYVNLTTPHRSNDTHRLLGLGQSENMFFNRGFGASVMMNLRSEQTIGASKIEIFEEESGNLITSSLCRPDYCGLSLNQTVYPGVSLINYSLSEFTRGSPGLGEGVDLLRLQSATGSNRWFQFVMTDRCGDQFVSRIRFN